MIHYLMYDRVIKHYFEKDLEIYNAVVNELI